MVQLLMQCCFDIVVCGCRCHSRSVRAIRFSPTLSLGTGLLILVLFPPHPRLLVIGFLSSYDWRRTAIDLKMGGGRRGGLVGIDALSGQGW